MHLKLMADYQCWPLWNIEPDEYHNVDPRTLPISVELANSLVAWADRLDTTLNWNDPGATKWPEHFWAQFNAEGAAFAERLRGELGQRYSITHHVWVEDT